MAVPAPTRRLSPREIAAVDRSRADFAAGRILDDAEYEAAMSTFMAELEAAASSKMRRLGQAQRDPTFTAR